MRNEKAAEFFIGSNSGRGFYSYFDSFYDSREMKRVFLLKGGAGNGKSTLMKKIAEAGLASGLRTEKIYCPSDPSSLDAVMIGDTGAAVIDATPPHALEAEYHGVLDRYISLSEYVDFDGAVEERDEIVALTGEIKACHDAARKRLAGAYSASNAMIGLILNGVDTARLSRRGASLAGKYIPQRRGAERSKVKKRFLSGITPKGSVSFPATVKTLAGACGQQEIRNIAVWDDYGLSPFLLSPVLDAATENGYEVYACYAPLVPSCLTGVIVPELGLVFAVGADGMFDHEENVRNIRLNDAIAPDVMKKSRSRLKILRRAERALIEDACDCLAEALRLHDMLEGIYIRYTDYNGLNRLADQLIEACCG